MDDNVEGIVKAMSDLHSNVSFGGGGRSGGGGGGGATLTSSPRPRSRPARITPANSGGGGGNGNGGVGVRDAVATGVCWIAGGVTGTVAALGVGVLTKNPVATWTAAAIIGGAYGDLCNDVLKK